MINDAPFHADVLHDQRDDACTLASEPLFLLVAWMVTSSGLLCQHGELINASVWALVLAYHAG